MIVGARQHGLSISETARVWAKRWCGSAETHWIHYITYHLADAFIQSDLQLIRLSRRHTPWSNVGLRALFKGPTAVQILLWPHQGLNHRPCGCKSSNLTSTLQAAPVIIKIWMIYFTISQVHKFVLKFPYTYTLTYNSHYYSFRHSNRITYSMLTLTPIYKT